MIIFRANKGTHQVTISIILKKKLPSTHCSQSSSQLCLQSKATNVKIKFCSKATASQSNLVRNKRGTQVHRVSCLWSSERSLCLCWSLEPGEPSSPNRDRRGMQLRCPKLFLYFCYVYFQIKKQNQSSQQHSCSNNDEVDATVVVEIRIQYST